jgi:hypothetical protein
MHPYPIDKDESAKLTKTNSTGPVLIDFYSNRVKEW